MIDTSHGPTGELFLAPSTAADGWWYLAQVVPGSPALHAVRGLTLTGELDVSRLRTAWLVVVARHDALRLTLAPGRRPVPVVNERPGPGSFVTVLTADGSAPRHGSADAREHWTRAPFDLSTGAVRLVVVSRDRYHHDIVVVGHRAVVDERSLAVVVEELSTLYLRPSAPLAAAMSYRDAVAHLTAGAPDAEPLRHRLTPVPGPVRLPADRPRPDALSSPAGTTQLVWTDFPRAQLDQLAREHGVSPATVLLAGLAALVHRYHPVETVVLGVRTPGVPPGFARVVGPFETVVPVALDLTVRPGLSDLVASAAAQLNAPVPLVDAVRTIPLDRDPSRVPLTDVVFVDRGGLTPSPADGSGITVDPIGPATTLVDLAVQVDSTGPVVTATLTYRTDLFNASTVERIGEHWRVLTAAGVTTPLAPVAGLPLEDPAGLPAALAAADRTDEPHPTDEDQLAPALIRRRATEQPDTYAVDSGLGRMTYRGLRDQADAITAQLRSRGPIAGRPVVVRVPPGPAQMAALLGVLGAGASIVWLGMTDPGERGRSILADLRPAAILVDASGDPDGTLGWFDAAEPSWIIDVADLAAPDGPVEPTPVRPTDIAYVAYTSGSTGRPKGIAQTHGALAQFAGWLGDEFGLRPGARVAQWVAPEHDPALCEVFANLLAGATLCPVPPRVRLNPERFVDWLAEERISFLQTVPSFARQLLQVLTDHPAARLRHFERLILMGEALPAHLVNSLRAVLPLARLANIYGPTETVAATWYEISGTIAGATPIGRPIPGRAVLVLDDDDRPCPTGVPGQLVVHSRYVADGYLGAASADRSSFTAPDPAPLSSPGGWYRTGDLARRGWDGELVFEGRRDLQVKLAGNRLELTDIEAALAGHESVAECAVTAVTDRDGLVARLVAHVVPRPPAEGREPGTPEQWRAHLRSRFGRSALPVLFRTVHGGLPRTVAGKVDRRRLPGPGTVRSAEGWSPRTPTERALSDVWATVLGAGPTGADETFFAHGGHSLAVVVLLDEVRIRFGVEVAINDFLADPTVTGLAAIIDGPRQFS